MSLWTRISGLFRGRAAKASGSIPGQVIPDQSLWFQFQRIGGALTPQQVSDIIRMADTGDMSSLVDLANEMRQKDGHLQSVLQTRETALCGLGWELVYPGQDPKARKGARQRKFVERVLKTHPDLRRLIAHLTGAAYYGYAVSEIVWGVKADRMVPERFICHGARRFGFRQEDGRFVWRDVGTSQTGIDFLAAYPDKFIVSQPRINGDVPCREGLVRVLMWLALFRNWALSDWLKLAEIAWKPWRLAKYDKKNASKEDKELAAEIVAGMTASGVAVHPDTVTVDLKWPEGATAGKGQGGTHDALFDVAGREMSKATLGQTLTTEQGRVGSQALGNVHNEVRMDILRADAEHIADVITKFLIEPMIRLNFGPNAPVPRFQFVTEDATDMAAFATALEKLAPILAMPAEWARDKLGIPHPEEDQELVGAAVDVDLGDLEDPDPEPENDDDAEEDDDADKAA